MYTGNNYRSRHPIKMHIEYIVEVLECRYSEKYLVKKIK